MADYGAKMADRAIHTVDRKLRAIYTTARKELEKKLADFVKKYAQKDAIKRQQLADGTITKAEYDSWKKGQIFQQKQWEAKLASVNKILHNSNREAARIIHEKKIDVFSDNYNYSAFVAEKVTGVNFNIYNSQAVARLIEENPQVLPEWKIDQKKDYVWNHKKAVNMINQGIIQGESISQMAERLCRDLATTNRKKMEMFARTAITGAQNAGRQQQMEDAEKMGIRQKKQWVATLDMRTRDAHRHLDGDTVGIHESFKSDLGEIRFPGDPEAVPANVFNCRCRTVTIYPDYPDADADWREREVIDGQSYQEWKKGKVKK